MLVGVWVGVMVVVSVFVGVWLIVIVGVVVGGIQSLLIEHGLYDVRTVLEKLVGFK